jgi:hypothetical protein
MQITAVGDMYNQLILSYGLKTNNIITSMDLIPLIRKAAINLIEFVAADKGYDSQANHKFVIEELKARS